MKTIRTEAPSPVRALRSLVATARSAYIAVAIKAAEADVKTWRETAATAEAYANNAERELVRLRRKFNAIR
jgi:hypothetical protein